MQPKPQSLHVHSSRSCQNVKTIKPQTIKPHLDLDAGSPLRMGMILIEKSVVVCSSR
jgi:hypothetical protein